MKKSRVFFIRADGAESPDLFGRKVKDVLVPTGFVEKLAPEDFVALKIHFGEKGNTGHIKSAWLRGLAAEIFRRAPRAFLTDSNTLYTGPRSNSVEHIRLAWSHGFTPDVLGLPIVIADGLSGGDYGETRGGRGRVASAKIAGAIARSDALLGLAHVTGHVQTGIGGAIKNLGMGCASRAGKLDQHAVVHPRIQKKSCRDCGLCLDHCPAAAIVRNPDGVEIDGARCTGCGECLVTCKYGAVKIRWDEDSLRIQEKVAEYALLVARRFPNKIAFINFLIRVTKDCDCMARTQPPLIGDIGLLASVDPVAVDRASADLVLRRAGGTDVFRKGYDIDWSRQFSYAEKIGLGSNRYDLVELK
ncbi:MAG: DUF362 domain-containing protein [Candidatus Aminicenantes bacterium]|nr:DUF362 domain-containing protein [Candidatus Aminicenantes bacterium]